jgi:predicted nucleic acid-binding protein
VTESERVIAQVLVPDAMSLVHFGRADRLDVLRALLIDKDCWTTQVVLEELRRGADTHPELTGVDVSDWVAVAPLDTFEELRTFAIWAERIGSGERDQGEASVFAVADLLSATAITDDREAVRVARTYGLNVHGTIWVLSGACRDGKLSEPAAGNMFDALRATGLRLPCTGAEFPSYARQHGLL